MSWSAIVQKSGGSVSGDSVTRSNTSVRSNNVINTRDNAVSATTKNNSGTKKSQKRATPHTLLLGDLLKPSTIAKAKTGSSVTVKQKSIPAKQKASNAVILEENLKPRGRMREVPKDKKPSLLKRSILDQRLEESKEHTSDTALVQSGESSVSAHLVQDVQSTTNFDTNTSAANLSAEAVQSVDTLHDEQSDHGHGVEEDDAEARLIEESSAAHEETVAKRYLRLKQELVPLEKQGTYGMRSYVHQVITAELNDAVKDVLSDLMAFQSKLYARDPKLAAMKKRIVCGFHEVRRYTNQRLLKCVLLAPNIEPASALDTLVEEIITSARKQDIPVIFCFSRRKLGQVIKKPRGASCVGILDASGTEQKFPKMVKLSKRCITAFELLVQKRRLSKASAMASTGTDESHQQQPSAATNRALLKLLRNEVAVELPLIYDHRCDECHAFFANEAAMSAHNKKHHLPKRELKFGATEFNPTFFTPIK